MKKAICTAAASLAVLGLGLFLAGALSMGRTESEDMYRNPGQSAGKPSGYSEAANGMNIRENTVILPSGTETVLEAENPALSPTGEPGPETVGYIPQTEPPAAAPEGYTLPETVQLEDGRVGQLMIDKIGLSAPVYETADEMEAMRKGVAHYPSTSAWEGNIGLCAHNGDGPACFFRDLHKLEPGDEITYATALGTRRYVVDVVKEIAETDWSMLGRTDGNRLTMTTCIDGKPEKRLCVQATEREDDY